MSERNDGGPAFLAASEADRAYVFRLALAYLEAPTDSGEEKLLDDALVLACDRVGLDADAILDRLTLVRP